MKFYAHAIRDFWNPAGFEPKVVAVYVERKVRDWRWLWLRTRIRGEVVTVKHWPDIQVKLVNTSDRP